MSAIKNMARRAARALGYELSKVQAPANVPYADPSKLEKASRYDERYREIISDPINMLIERVPEAGYVDSSGYVVLHNGHRVPVAGELAYCSDFSDILVINRGVHEPLEEFCFQELLKKLRGPAPKMIELGSYWAHYSMWLLQRFPGASCCMVEPERGNKECGENNFRINGYRGEFIEAFVGSNGFQLDAFTSERGISSLDILHSDIQGYEVEMLEGGQSFLGSHGADYIFISTHSDSLHASVLGKLEGWDYRIEVSSPVDAHTTSGDGFVLATSPKVEPLFKSFSPLGRTEILAAKPAELIESIRSIRVS
jgi:hypothetical protein